MKRQQATILDIARELGISKSTVSRALTGSTNIHPDTRQRILETAQRLDYQPNLLAQSLIRHETHLLGVVIPDIEKPFFARIASGIQHQAAQAGYRVIIAQSNESPDTEIQNVQALMISQVDGLLVCHTRETQQFEHMRLLHRKQIPLVSFGRVCPDLPIPKIVENDREGARLMTNYLIAQGHRRIAILAGPPALLISNLRLAGYRDALAENGLPNDETLVFYSHFTTSEARQVADTLLSQRTLPDALYSIYDAGAIDIILRLREKGVRVPNDIAIAGFGDDPAAVLISPSLTTYQQLPYEIGRVACKVLLDILSSGSNKQEDSLQIIPGNLIKRESA